MNLSGILKRLVLTGLVFFGAATLNFFLPRLSGGDPIAERLAQLGDSGGTMSAEALSAMIASYNEPGRIFSESDRPFLEGLS